MGSTLVSGSSGSQPVSREGEREESGHVSIINYSIAYLFFLLLELGFWGCPFTAGWLRAMKDLRSHHAHLVMLAS